jgi:hypothetical protein
VPHTSRRVDHFRGTARNFGCYKTQWCCGNFGCYKTQWCCGNFGCYKTQWCCRNFGCYKIILGATNFECYKIILGATEILSATRSFWVLRRLWTFHNFEQLEIYNTRNMHFASKKGDRFVFCWGIFLGQHDLWKR